MDRKEMIAYLEGLQSGQVELHDLLAQKTYMFQVTNKKYVNERTGEVLTEDEFKRFRGDKSIDDIIWIEERSYATNKETN